MSEAADNMLWSIIEQFRSAAERAIPAMERAVEKDTTAYDLSDAITQLRNASGSLGQTTKEYWDNASARVRFVSISGPDQRGAFLALDDRGNIWGHFDASRNPFATKPHWEKFASPVDEERKP